jgi:hypothetical protein
MSNRNTQSKRPEMMRGMSVRSRDGKELGTVIRCNEADFQIEKGVFFPDEYLASYEDVDTIREERGMRVVVLRTNAEQLRPMNPLGPEATGLARSDEDLQAG